MSSEIDTVEAAEVVAMPVPAKMSPDDWCRGVSRRDLDLRLDGEDSIDAHPHRPEIGIWADYDADIGGVHVAVSMSAMWSQTARFLAMDVREARKLAKYLNEIADQIEGLGSETVDVQSNTLT